VGDGDGVGFCGSSGGAVGTGEGVGDTVGPGLGGVELSAISLSPEVSLTGVDILESAIPDMTNMIANMNGPILFNIKPLYSLNTLRGYATGVPKAFINHRFSMFAALSGAWRLQVS
jgi:hypothetical protein